MFFRRMQVKSEINIAPISLHIKANNYDAFSVLRYIILSIYNSIKIFIVQLCKRLLYNLKCPSPVMNCKDSLRFPA